MLKRRGLRAVVAYVCLLLMASQSVAQEDLFGRVVDEKNQPIVGAILSLNNLKDSATINYTFTDGKGQWKMAIPAGADSVFLKVSVLGYQAKTLLVSQPIQQDLGSIVLQEDVRLLDGVDVQGERKGIIQNGDTLLYDIDLFLTGSERSLKDVLENLPGITVQEDGTVQYNGKRIKVLLLDGKDILNNQHKLATEGINADYIKAIQIIENFRKGSQQLFRLPTEQTAMNVRLKDSAKNRVMGNASAAAGYDKKAAFESTLFRVNERTAFTNFGRYNNTGTQTLSMMDYLSLQPSAMEWFREGLDTEKILPEHFSLPTFLQSNNDALIAQNNQIDSPKGHTTNVSVLLTRFDRKSAYTLARSYLRSQAELKGAYAQRDVLTMFQTTLKHTWKSKNEKSWIDVESPLLLEKFSLTSEINGEFNRSPTATSVESSHSTFSAAPYLRYTFALSERLVISNKAQYLYELREENQDLQDIFPLFDTDTVQIGQGHQQAELDFSNSTRVEYEWLNNHTLTLKHTFRHNTRKNTATSEFQPFNWENELNRRFHQTNVTYYFDNQKWKLRAQLEGFALKTQLEQGVFRKFFVNTLLGAEYKFDELHSLSISVSDKKTPLSLNVLNANEWIKNGQTVIRGMNRPDTLVHHKSIKAMYIHFNQRTFRRKLLQIEYAQRNNEAVVDNFIIENFTEQTWRLAQQQSLWKVNTMVSYPILGSRLKVDFNGLFTSQKIRFSESETVRLQMGQLTTSLKASLTQKLTTISFFSIHMLSNRESVVGTANEFLNAKWANRFNYKSEKWYVEVEPSFNVNFVNANLNKHFWNVNAEISYTINKHWSLSLQGNNLINLEGIPNIRVQYSPNFEQETNYLQFPGFVLLKAAYLL